MGALPITIDEHSQATLPALIDRAAQKLASAGNAAEVLEARGIASFAYDVAKKQARIAKAKKAHDDVIAAVHRAQADALEIEALADCRLADEYDAAQERGEVQRPGGDRVSIIPDGNNAPKVADLGLSAKGIHEARIVRDAENAEPGIVKQSIEERLEAGDEPTRAHLRGVVMAAVMSGGREPRQSRKNPIYKPDPVFDALLQLTGSCRDIIAVREANEVAALLGSFIDGGMRSRDLRSIRLCRDLLTEILEAADAA